MRRSLVFPPSIRHMHNAPHVAPHRQRHRSSWKSSSDWPAATWLLAILITGRGGRGHGRVSPSLETLPSHRHPGPWPPVACSSLEAHLPRDRSIITAPSSQPLRHSRPGTAGLWLGPPLALRPSHIDGPLANGGHTSPIDIDMVPSVSPTSSHAPRCPQANIRTPETAAAPLAPLRLWTAFEGEVRWPSTALAGTGEHLRHQQRAPCTPPGSRQRRRSMHHALCTCAGRRPRRPCRPEIRPRSGATARGRRTRLARRPCGASHGRLPT